MKATKKLLAIFLALALAASTAACSGGGESSGSSPSSGEGSSGVSQEGNVEDGSLPLVDEKTTISIFGMTNVLALESCDTDYNDLPFFQELEERTNVHIDWTIPASGTESEQMNLMFSSGNLPDMVFCMPGMREYSDGPDAAVEDGYFLDLTDLLPTLAPDYLAAVESLGERAVRDSKTDGDRYVYMLGCQHVPQPPWQGWMIRGDWLDDLGLDVPVTYDDWETALTAFRDEKGASAPLTTNTDGVWQLGAGMGAYGEWYNLDGEARYGMVDDVDATKEYLTLLNRWYNEGLLDRDFASNPVGTFDDSIIINGKSGVVMQGYTAPSNNFIPSMGDGVYFVALSQPKATEDQELHWNFGMTQYTSSGYAVSADSENAELCIRWFNYLYTDEGSTFANYGLEGEQYTLDDNGEPQFEDFMLEDFNANMCQFTMPPGMPCYQDYRRELQAVPEEDAAMMDVWGSDGEEYQYPGNATMTPDEGAEYAQLYTDIETYADESMLQFITGARSIDEYDDFVATLQSMNIDRCRELKQAALDRYLAH